MATLQERNAVLRGEITKYVKMGYRVTNQTDTSAQMVKPKKFSWIIFLGTVWLFGLGLLYLIYFWVKKEKAAYLEVDDGGVAYTNGKRIGKVKLVGRVK